MAELQGIGVHSDGYPFLAAARRLGLPYGTVLAYADAVRKDLGEFSEDETRKASSYYDFWERCAVKRVLKATNGQSACQQITVLVKRMLLQKAGKA